MLLKKGNRKWPRMMNFLFFFPLLLLSTWNVEKVDGQGSKVNKRRRLTDCDSDCLAGRCYFSGCKGKLTLL